MIPQLIFIGGLQPTSLFRGWCYETCPNISNNLFGGLLFINISIGYYWKERTQFFGYNFAFHQVTIREVSLHVARQVWRRASTFDVWVGALRWLRAETVRKTPWSWFFVCSEFLGHSELVGEIRICGQFVWFWHGYVWKWGIPPIIAI